MKNLEERQKREIERLESKIKPLKFAWAELGGGVDIGAIMKYERQLEQVTSDPEEYFKNIDEEE